MPGLSDLDQAFPAPVAPEKPAEPGQSFFNVQSGDSLGKVLLKFLGPAPSEFVSGAVDASGSAVQGLQGTIGADEGGWLDRLGE